MQESGLVTALITSAVREQLMIVAFRSTEMSHSKRGSFYRRSGFLVNLCSQRVSVLRVP
jgi:hypothetical protein